HGSVAGPNADAPRVGASGYTEFLLIFVTTLDDYAYEIVGGLSLMGPSGQSGQYQLHLTNTVQGIPHGLVSVFRRDMNGNHDINASGVISPGTSSFRVDANTFLRVFYPTQPSSANFSSDANFDLSVVFTPRPYIWEDSVDGDFTDATKWVNDNVPTPLHAATFDKAGSYTVTLDADVAVAETRVLAGDVTLEFGDNSFQTGDVIVNGPGASLTFDGGSGVVVSAAAAAATSSGPIVANSSHQPFSTVSNIIVREGEWKSIRNERLVVDNQIYINSGDEASGGGSRIGLQSVVSAKRLMVGDTDEGVLIIDEQSTLTIAEDAILGDNFFPLIATGKGQVWLFNASKLDVLGRMIIGVAGDGDVRVTQGSELLVRGDLIIADSSTNDASLSISGSGIDPTTGDRLPSRLIAGSDIKVSVGNGRADLRVFDGGRLLDAAELTNATLKVGPDGTVTVGGLDAQTGAKSGLGSYYRDISLGISISGLPGLFDDATLQVHYGGEVAARNIDVSTVTPAAAGTTSGVLLVDAAGGAPAATDPPMVMAVNLNVGERGRVEVRNNGSIAIGAEDTLFLSDADFRNKLTLLEGGTLSGDGEIVAHFQQLGGTDNFTGARTLPGTSPGRLRIVGDADFLGGILEIEIGGPDAETRHDVLEVVGNVTVDGAKILFKFLDGFAPQQGQTFNFLSVTGDLDFTSAQFEIRNLRPGFQFDVSFSNGILAMTALNDGVFVPEPSSMALAVLTLAGLTVGYCRLAARRASW
ncbi:MAG: hypothetical protein WD229_04010, partial [Pirellulales bacterium]